MTPASSTRWPSRRVCSKEDAFFSTLDHYFGLWLHDRDAYHERIKKLESKIARLEAKGQEGVKTVLHLPYPPSVNGLFATNKKTGGRFKSSPYKKWIEAAGWAIRTQPDRNNEHHGPVRMTLLIRKPGDNRRRDLLNLEKAVSDLLVFHRILADDSLIEHSEIRWVYEGFEGAKVIIEDLETCERSRPLLAAQAGRE